MSALIARISAYPILRCIESFLNVLQLIFNRPPQEREHLIVLLLPLLRLGRGTIMVKLGFDDSQIYGALSSTRAISCSASISQVYH